MVAHPTAAPVTGSSGRSERLAAVVRPRWATYRLVGIVAAAVAAVDGASTLWAVRHVPLATPAAGRTTGWVTLARVQNGGAAFGLGAGHPLLVIAVSVTGLAALLAWPRWATGRLELVAVGVVLGGALANLADRLAQGTVTDWIHLAGYPPTFNPADICIRLGAVLALLTHVTATRRQAPAGKDPGTTTRFATEQECHGERRAAR